MKNQRIREAWNEVSPTLEQKQRMRQALMARMEAEVSPEPELDLTLPEDPYLQVYQRQDTQPEEKKKRQPKVYSQRQKPARSRNLPAILAAMLLLAAASGMLLGFLSMGTEADPSVVSPPQTLPSETEPTEEAVAQHYQEIIDTYVIAISENWNAAQCAQGDISESIVQVENLEDAGYALMDVDGDGEEELLITGGDLIYDLYGFRNGAITHDLMSFDRIGYYLRKGSDGYYILNIGSGGGAVEYNHIFRMEQGELIPVDSLIFNADKDPDHPWFRETEAGETPVSTQEAEEILGSYVPAEIAYTPFSGKRQTLEECYQKLADKYVTALREEWDAETCKQQGISELVSLSGNADKWGYVYLDLDGNGTDDMIVTDGRYVYDLYVYGGDGNPSRLLTALYRTQYEINLAGFVYMTDSVTLTLTQYRCFRFVDGELVTEYHLSYDASPDAQSPWSQKNDTGMFVPITMEQAQELMDLYQPSSISEYTPFLTEPVNGDEKELLKRYAENISYAFEDYDRTEEKTFCFYDSDGDGREELLLGAGESVYRILQPRTGNESFIDIAAPVGNEGTAYLCEGNVFACTAYAQGNTHYQFLKIGDATGAMEVNQVDYVFHDPERGWYLGGSGINTPIPDEKGEEVVNSYTRIALEWKPISQFPVPIPSENFVEDRRMFESLFLPIASGQRESTVNALYQLVNEHGYHLGLNGEGRLTLEEEMPYSYLLADWTDRNGEETLYEMYFQIQRGDGTRWAIARFTDQGRELFTSTDLISLGVRTDIEDMEEFLFGQPENLELRRLVEQFTRAYTNVDSYPLEEMMASAAGPISPNDLPSHGYNVKIEKITGLDTAEDNYTYGGIAVVSSAWLDGDSYTYLTLELTKEDGQWKVLSFGLEK